MRDGQRVEDVGIDGVVIDVDPIHFLPDLFERRFLAQAGQV